MQEPSEGNRVIKLQSTQHYMDIYQPVMWFSPGYVASSTPFWKGALSFILEQYEFGC